MDLNVAFWGLLLYNALYRNNLQQRYRCDTMQHAMDNKGTVVQLSCLSKQTCKKSKKDRNSAGTALTCPKELLSDWFGLMCCVILTRLTAAASVFWNQTPPLSKSWCSLGHNLIGSLTILV